MKTEGNSSLWTALAAFFLIVVLGFGFVFSLAAFGIVEEKLYKESFIVTEVGTCNNTSCSIKMRKVSDGTIWDGKSKDLVVEGAYVFLVCNRNYLTNKVDCDGFYTFPQSEAYPLSQASKDAE